LAVRVDGWVGAGFGSFEVDACGQAAAFSVCARDGFGADAGGLRRWIVDTWPRSESEGNSGGDLYGYGYGYFGEFEPSGCVDGDCAVRRGRRI
jgi:hypothetical protein